jgi:uncharacterized protein (DUF302 family)
MESIQMMTSKTITEAEAAVRSSLQANGFGVLTEIDVAATFKAKLGIDRSPMKILGACNPHLAHRALELDPTVSLLLPCNVVLEVTPDGTRVSAVDPRALMNDPAFNDLAIEAAAKLTAAITSVA